MKKVLMTLSLLFLSIFCISQELSKLDSLLCEIYASDQSVRQEVMRILPLNNADSTIFAISNMDRVDSLNQIFVFDLLDNNGWISGLSKDANKAIFLVIDHAGLKNQQKYFPMIKQGADSGFISKGDCATLQDRILMKEGKKQIYGTQTAMISKNGKSIIYLWPIEDLINIDTIRKGVDLGTLSAYIEIMKQSGYDVIVDHDFTIEELSKRLVFD